MDLTPFVDAETGHAVTLRSLTSHEAVDAAWHLQLKQAVAHRMNDLDRAGQYAADCPVPGAEPRDYTLRHIDLGDDGRFLAGIHFLRMDVSRPFVGVIARTMSFEDAAHIRRVSRALTEQLSLFSPESVWFFQADGAIEFSLGDYPGGKLDQHLLAARVNDMREATPPGLERMEARPPADGWFQRYSEVYHRFLVTHPHRRDYLSPESEADLLACQQNGALLELWVDGRYGGLIAATPDTRCGVTGSEMWEILLDDPWRGKGLAAACHRRLADHLPEDGIVWGTVDARNIISRRAAQRAGRSIVGRWWFVPFSLSR